MPKSVFVEELEAGEPVQSVFLARSLEMRQSRDGENYLHLTLADRTGEIVGRAWTDPEILVSRVTSEDFVALRGETKLFGKELYIEVADIDRVPDESVDSADFFPTSRWSGEDLFDQLLTFVDEAIDAVPVRRFLHEALRDEAIRHQFPNAPAAMRNHHAFLGGLAEHVLSMARLAQRIGEHYRDYYPGVLNTDLVIAGCILHDIAKVWELEWRRDFTYSDPGRLIGHIPMGIQFVRRVSERLHPSVDEELVWRLEHLVASHHGQLEYGSPVRPQTPEAIVLHQIDMIDSRMNICWNEVTSAQGDGARWSGYNRSLEARLFVGAATGQSKQLPKGPGLALPDRHAEPKDSNLDLFEG